jgi:hypothetical protein
MMPNDARMQIGLIVDSEMTSKYVCDLADWGRRQNDLVISPIIVHRQQRPGIFTGALRAFRTQGVSRFFNSAGFGIILSVERCLLRRNREHRNHSVLCDLRKISARLISVIPIISGSGRVCFSPDDVERIRNMHLDLLIGCGSGVLQGDILRSARLGVIAFHQSHRGNANGIPAGFWEVSWRQDSTAFAIRQVTADHEDGKVLVKGKVPTQYFSLLNEACLLSRSYSYMKQLLLKIAATGELPKLQKQWPGCDRLFEQPTLRQQITYGMGLCARAVRRMSRFARGRADRWGVAFGKGEWRQMAMSKAVRIPNEPNHFLADPFVIADNDRTYCFVEDYNYETRKGCIAVYELNEDRAQRIGVAIAEPFSMSFPFLFRFGGRLFMCPETCACKEIRVYQCEKFPLEWKIAGVLMKDVYASDTMIIKHDSRWWMFTNIDQLDTSDGQCCSELDIFHSEDPLSDKWIPHLKNPIYIDSTRARNAGLLHDRTSLSRVSQRQGFDRYGKSLAINQILILKPEEYREAEVHSIEPDFFPKLEGCHHFHSNGTFSVFDYVEVVNPRR